MLVFLNPLFLWALAAAALPLVLHLFQRRRTVLTPFPTVRFLKLAQKRSSSRVRFENLLLWLLRTLLLAALAAAFAMPVIRKTSAADWLTRTRRDVIIVIDASYSMAYETERGTVFDVAKEAAVALIESLGQGDRVCLYLAAATPQPIIERPTSELNAALQAVRALEWQHGGAALAQTLALALFNVEQQADAHREREVYVLSDGQARPWQELQATTDAANPAAPATSVISREHRENIPLFAMLAGAESPENTWPAALTVTPPLILAGKTARLDVKIGRHGPGREVSLAVFIGDEERLNRGVFAAADGETAIELALPALEAGTWPAVLRTTVDALPCDDEFYFLLRVRDQLPVLVVGPDHSTRFLRAALAPGGAEAVRAIAGEDLTAIDLADFEAIFLADALPLSGQAIMRLEEYVRAGGVLGIFAGDRAPPQAYADLGALLPARVRETVAIPTAAAARQLGRVSREDEIFRNFRFPQGVVPTIALKRVCVVEPPEDNTAPVLNAGHGQPFLLVRDCGRGKVFQFTVSADRDWSTLPLTAFFLPLVHQVIRHGAGATQYPPYAPLHTDLPAGAYAANLTHDDRLLAPSGHEVALRDAPDRSYTIEALDEPGFYGRWRPAGATPQPLLAANTDRRESQLDTATPEEIAAWSGFKNFRAVRSPEELLAVIDSMRNGRALIEPLLWLILALAAVEWWFANRALRKRAKLTDSLTIDAAGKVSGAIT